jgi:hypothetical protein
MRPAASVIPSAPNRQREANKMYIKAIEELKHIKRPLHITLQEGDQGEPSCADMKNILGKDEFFTMEYIKEGKRQVTAIISADYFF